MTTHVDTTTLSLSLIRNIGVSAHIDAGKTTLTERILFHAGKIRKIGEIRSEAGATMDSMDLERERGITIQSASTQVRWQGHAINLIDTPGHVDFTVEVERALAVLDGAILVLCGVAGVQPQTLTVDRQMRRHELPRLCFINKLDREGADALAVAGELRARIDAGAVLVNLPIIDDGGRRRRLVGVVDVLRGVALTFSGPAGSIVTESPPPESMLEPLRQARARLCEVLADHDEAILAAVVGDQPVDEATLARALRAATLARAVTPILCGSAHENIGVQPLLDAVVRYLPAPDVRGRTLHEPGTGEAVPVRAGAEGPTCALAFKIDDGAYGQLTSLRILQGRLCRGDRLTNGRTGERIRVGRLVRMHADQMEEIEAAGAGDIVGLFGAPCEQSDVFSGDGRRLVARPLDVPEAVMAYAIRPRDPSALARFSRALGRFAREDPSLKVSRDPESGETILAGVGELHLEVVLERMRREFDLDLEVGPPEIAYRETVTRPVDFDHIHKKQDGGQGQYARVRGELAPAEGPDAPRFVDQIVSGAIPREMIPACEQGLGDALARGILIGAPVVGVTMTLRDGAAHAKDSSPLAFRTATAAATRKALQGAGPAILEPCMRVSVDAPERFSGAVISGLLRRRGRVVGQALHGGEVRVEAIVPLAEMFGYVGDLRSVTQGQGSFSMEMDGYEPVPEAIQRSLIARYGRRAPSIRQ